MPAASCENCGSTLPNGSRFCPECGARVGAGAGETAVEELPPDETGQVPVEYETARPRYFGVFRPAKALAPVFRALRETTELRGRVRRRQFDRARRALPPPPRAGRRCWPQRAECARVARRGGVRWRRGRDENGPRAAGRARRARQREGGRDGANSRRRHGADSARAAPGAADPDRAAGAGARAVPGAEPAAAAGARARSRRPSRPSRPGPAHVPEPTPAPSPPPSRE